ncbi:hypothetical protein, partial [Escherichia coli]|uniref:hypothetical protein n=1 Tax=Escherichia coli TaxID=562 RepID=UPI000CDB6960
QENKNKKNEEKYVNPVKITMRSGLNYIEQESLRGKYLTHDLSIKIADISEEIIQQAILSAMSIYKFPITDDLMSMATNELIKLANIENNLDLNKFSTICTDVLSPLSTRNNKEKKPDDLLPFAKNPFLIFIEKMEIDNMNPDHA